MKLIFTEYSIILIFLSISFLLSVLFFSLSYFLIPKKADQEKISAYECGFNPFDDARATFDIRFYLVAILFLIFDLEISFLFPWSLALNSISLFGFWSMIIFLIILTIGFIYEWYKGALEWE
uniref:NADH-ubiquinone oxidoreductase chain 3 n=2 Tax=Gracilaria tenuistipitata TaxID=2510778 RepID=A0A2S1PUR4_GRATE|nr:NADH dehydrogenase subunit 3 [Gracilaria tenuistipitata]ARU07648.1 NADH dehydrogenase subunit 3 [Gracilaria tenuistipitata]AWH62571.1 NADH dehydrogenase subunit 3 [Gracilaria tenuistipitata]AWH62596.1 NADH dehydrogenase subunit 3 [Gracilaria tenuistipitata var. liui]AXI97780.1 NADH dehydrogenase subunit 3 [Gracilaria tenuistipitata]